MLSFFYRSILFYLLIIAALAWFFKGGDWLQGGVEDPNSRKLREMLKSIEKSNPEAAKRIKEAGKKNPYAVAVSVATIKNQKDYEKQLAKFAESLKDEESNPFIEAIELCVGKDLVRDNEDRKKIIYAHGSFLYIKDSELLKKAINEKSLEEKEKYKADIQKLVEEHFDRLKKFSKDPEIWEIVKYDPVAVMVYSEVEDSKLRNFYKDNHDWVQDMFSQFQNIPKENEGIKEGSVVTITSVLETASKYYPETKNAVVDQKHNGCGFGPLGFQLFFNYGELIKTCVEKEKVLPLCETLEIFFAQHDYLNTFIDKHSSDSAPSLLARNLGEIKKTSPDLWRAAKASPGALDLYEDAKEFANDVFKNCDGINVQDLLYADYFTPDRVLLKNAAHALAKWGELAFYTLNQYSDHVDNKPTSGNQVEKKTKISGEFNNNNFKRALSKDFRTVFYVFRIGQSGISEILDNPRCIDKFVDEKGELKPEAYSKSIPFLGGPITVFDNWVNGYPNSYAELGWAALDIADDIATIVLLVGTPFTAGSSGSAAIAKTAAKTAAKKAAKTAAKKALENKVKTGFAKFAETALSKVLHGLITVSKVGFTISVKIISFAGKVVDLALYLARAAIKVWSSLPTGFKSFVYKSFLAITISISIAFRTIPFLWNKFLEQIKKLLKELPGVIKEVFVNAPNDLFNALMTAIAEVFKEFGTTVKIAYWMVLLVLIFMIYLFVPTKRLKYA